MLEFKHPLLQKWVPSEIKITKEKYLKKTNKCSKCQHNFKKYNQEYDFNKLGTDIYFDVFYWLREDSHRNKFAFYDEMQELCYEFKCERMKTSEVQEHLLEVAEKIGIVDLVELCTYHSVWLHYYHHYMYSKDENIMLNWDSMYQSKHVHAKNELHFLIYLLLTSNKRKDLMNEIREFTLCPPMYENAISGYEYKITKNNFESKSKTLSS